MQEHCTGGQWDREMLMVWQRSSKPRRTPEAAEREMPWDQWAKLC